MLFMFYLFANSRKHHIRPLSCSDWTVTRQKTEYGFNRFPENGLTVKCSRSRYKHHECDEAQQKLDKKQRSQQKQKQHKHLVHVKRCSRADWAETRAQVCVLCFDAIRGFVPRLLVFHLLSHLEKPMVQLMLLVFNTQGVTVTVVDKDFTWNNKFN